MTTTSRPIRNNNPFDLDAGDAWQGLATSQTDGRFCEFTSMYYGTRAGYRALLNQQLKHGRNTIRKIAQSWAPGFENDQPAVIRNWSLWSGFAPDQVLDLRKAEIITPLGKAMMRQECAYVPVDDATIARAVQSALEV